MREFTSDFMGINRKKYTDAMAENLPMLRAKLGINQEKLAGTIGITRQTLSSIENRTRDMSWPTFISLLFLFAQNEETKKLLPVLGIYDTELERSFSFTDLTKLRYFSLCHKCWRQ